MFAVHQNYPNPFNPTTVISYDLPKRSTMKLVVYDIMGKEITTLVNETQDAGSYQVTLDASRFSSGMYFYRMTTGSYTGTRKMLLLK